MKTNDTKLVNRVANSRLKVINLEHFYPTLDIVEFDLKDFLFQGLILREKDFRSSLNEVDWTKYKDKAVAIHCSSDAIIPTWAFMLTASLLEPWAERVFPGTKTDLIREEYRKSLAKLDIAQYQDEMVVIKGCSQKPVPASAYVDLTTRLTSVARSIMFGEACSAVPIFKKPKNKTE